MTLSLKLVLPAILTKMFKLEFPNYNNGGQTGCIQLVDKNQIYNNDGQKSHANMIMMFFRNIHSPKK